MTDFYLISAGIRSCNLSVTSPTLYPLYFVPLHQTQVKISKHTLNLPPQSNKWIKATGHGINVQGPGFTSILIEPKLPVKLTEKHIPIYSNDLGNSYRGEGR
jgi:hypothetical protein